MRFQVACIISLLAYSATAMPGRSEPGVPVRDTQGVQLRDGETCKTTSTAGVLACSDSSGASFNIVGGQRENLRRRMADGEEVQAEKDEEEDGDLIEARSPQNGKRRKKQQQNQQNLPLRPGESCTPINNQPGVFGCQDGTGGTFNIVNGKRQRR